MITFTIRLADLNIGIEARYDSTRRFTQAYMTDGCPDFCISVSDSDLESERRHQNDQCRRCGEPSVRYSDEYYEILAVYRHIADRIPAYNTILFHGSAVAVDGEAYLFTASSGTGKSTHTRLWRELLGDRAMMINDDKPLLKCTEGGIFACGTPWDGKHRLSTNMIVPVKAICALERGRENRITRMPFADIYPVLLRQTYRPTDREMLFRTLSCLDRMKDTVAFWQLACNMDAEAARVSYTAMKEDQS